MADWLDINDDDDDGFEEPVAKDEFLECLRQQGPHLIGLAKCVRASCGWTGTIIVPATHGISGTQCPQCSKMSLHEQLPKSDTDVSWIE